MEQCPNRDNDKCLCSNNDECDNPGKCCDDCMDYTECGDNACILVSR